MNVVNAATLPTRTSNYYRNMNNYAYKSNTQRNNNGQPTRFYISAKGGYNLMYGSMYVDKYDNKGFSFSADKPVFSGALGLDFNRDPSLRVELEIANVAASEAKFSDGWDSKLHADVGYTSYMLNFIPYFKENCNIYFQVPLWSI